MPVSLGSLLKSKRTELGLSIEHIAESTRIAKSTLQSLEVGDYESLPARPFVRGFVRTYAKTLGLEPDEAVSLFELEAGQPKAPHQVSTPPDLMVNPSPEDKESVLWFQAPKFVFMVIGLLVTCALCIVIFFSLEKIQRYDVERSPTPQNSEGTVDSLSDEAQATQETSSDANAADANEIDDTQPTSKEKPAETDAASGKPAALVPKPETPKTSSLKTSAPKTTTAKAKNLSAQATSYTVSVRAYEPVVLKIKWSSGSTQVFDLKINEIKNVVFTQPVQLTINKGNGVRILFDGQPVAQGELSSDPVDLNFP